MKWLTQDHLLRLALIIVLLTHSLPSIFTGDVNNFGRLYLDAVGFAPFGLLLAWLIKLSHVACAVSLMVNRFLKPLGIVTIFIWLVGIFMVHWKEGWFVIGGGRNGIEYNVFLILAMMAVLIHAPKEKS